MITITIKAQYESDFVTDSVIQVKTNRTLTFCDPFSLLGMQPRHLDNGLSQFQLAARPDRLWP